MPPSNKAHQAVIKREFYAGATQSEALAAIRAEHGPIASSISTVERAWAKLKIEAAEKFKNEEYWTMEELRTKEPAALRQELFGWIGKEKVPLEKKAVLALIENTEKCGLVGELKAVFPLGKLTEEEKRKRDVDITAKRDANISSDQRRAELDRENKRRKELKEEKKDGRYVEGESPRDRDIAEYRSLREYLKEDNPRWGKLRHRVKQKIGNFDPVQTYNAFKEVRTKCFWLLMDMFHTYVDSIGVENFHGDVEYVWNARTWLSIILRLARSVDLEHFVLNNCWVSTDRYEEKRPQLRVNCNGKDFTRNSAIFACILLHGQPPIDQKQNKAEASHRCHNACCINPFHMIWEFHEVNKERNGCQYGAGFLCPHQEPCIFVNEDGSYFLCKNDPSKRECGCGFDCFDDFCNAPASSALIQFTPTRPDYSSIDKSTLDDPRVKKFKQMFDCLLSEPLKWDELPKDLRKVNTQFDPTAKFNGQNADQRQAFQTLVALLERFVFARIQLFEGDVDFIWTASEWLRILFNLARSDFVEGFNIENCWHSKLPSASSSRPGVFLNRKDEYAAWVSAILFSNGDPTLFARYSLEEFRAFDGSHRCSNGICVNPFHISLEETKENGSRKRCIHTCSSLCPHSIKCIYQRKGVYLPCRSDSNKRQCECDLNCFALDKVALDQVEDEGKSPDAESSNKLAKIETKLARTKISLNIQTNVSRHGLVGLANLGNTCFMNSALQILFNTLGIRQIFDMFSSNIGLLPVSNSFLKLMDAVCSSKRKYVRPTDFVEILKENDAGHFFDGQQHDAQEFMSKLLDLLRTETSQMPAGDVPNPIYYGESINDHAKDYAEQMSKYSLLPVNKQFWVRTVEQKTCKRCNTTSVKFFSELLIPLELPSDKIAGASLIDCLNSFFGRELLTGAQAYECSSCGSKQEAIKDVKGWSFSPILVIQFKRFGFDVGKKESKKNDVAIDFTSGGFDLDMKPYLHQNSDSGVEVKYELYAVLNHNGAIETGHYTATVYNSKAKKWLNFNDYTVTEIDQAKVQNQDAYMLFYRRKDLDISHDVEFDQAVSSPNIVHPTQVENVAEQADDVEVLPTLDQAVLSSNILIDPPNLNETELKQADDEENSLTLSQLRVLPDDDFIVLVEQKLDMAQKRSLEQVQSTLNENADVGLGKEKDGNSVHTSEPRRKVSSMLMADDVGEKGDQFKKKKPDNPEKPRVLPKRKAKEDGRNKLNRMIEEQKEFESEDGVDDVDDDDDESDYGCKPVQKRKHRN